MHAGYINRYMVILKHESSFKSVLSICYHCYCPCCVDRSRRSIYIYLLASVGKQCVSLLHKLVTCRYLWVGGVLVTKVYSFAGRSSVLNKSSAVFEYSVNRYPCKWTLYGFARVTKDVHIRMNTHVVIQYLNATKQFLHLFHLKLSIWIIT